jgi:hypothetical protein
VSEGTVAAGAAAGAAAATTAGWSRTTTGRPRTRDDEGWREGGRE